MSKFKRACRLLSLNDDTAESLRNALLEDERTKLELKQAKLQAVVKAAEAVNDIARKYLDNSKSTVEKLKTKLHEATPEELREGFEAAFVNKGGFMSGGQPFRPLDYFWQHKLYNDLWQNPKDVIGTKEDVDKAIALLKNNGYKVLKPTTKYHPV